MQHRPDVARRLCANYNSHGSDAQPADDLRRSRSSGAGELNQCVEHAPGAYVQRVVALTRKRASDKRNETRTERART